MMPRKPPSADRLVRRQQQEARVAELKRQRQLANDEFATKTKHHEEQVAREHRRVFSKPVILMVEDDLGRMEDIRRWTPPDVRVFFSQAEGVALGTVEHSGDEDLAGIMLDFDLKDERFNLDRKVGNTLELAKRIAQRISKDTPILVHSMNHMDRAEIISILQKAGFTVTVIPFWEMTEEKFLTWVGMCREVWKEREENRN